MRERSVHSLRPQRNRSFALRSGTVHTIHTPYAFFCICFLKINVIGNPYDLWRRAS